MKRKHQPGCKCCTGGGTGGPPCTTPGTLTYGVTGCLNLTGCTITVEDSTGTVLATHSASGSTGTSTTTYSVTVAGTYTIRLAAYPTDRWNTPTTTVLTRTIACAGTATALFSLTPKPYWSCCYPDRSAPFPATLTVTDGISSATLSDPTGAGIYRGCLPLLSVPVRTSCTFVGSSWTWGGSGTGDTILQVELDLRGGLYGCGGFSASIPLAGGTDYAVPASACVGSIAEIPSMSDCHVYFGNVADFASSTGTASPTVVDLFGSIGGVTCPGSAPGLGSFDGGIHADPQWIMCQAYGAPNAVLHFTG